MKFKDIEYYDEEDEKKCAKFLKKYSDLRSIKRGYLTPRKCIDFCLPKISKIIGDDAQIFMSLSGNPE